MQIFFQITFFKEKNITGILDFYFSCFDYLIYDIAIVINAWCFNNGVFKKKNVMNLFLVMNLSGCLKEVKFVQ